MLETPDLDGQTAFITGTSRGIGKRIALALAEAGCNIVSTGRTVEERDDRPGTIHETAEECAARGVDAHAIRLDVRDPDRVQAAATEAIEEMGDVNIVVNNAGALQLGTIEHVSADEFDRLHEVNARGTYLTARAFADHLKGVSHDAWVLTNAPPIAIDRSSGMAAYAWSKMGMAFVTHSLASELNGDDVGCNTFWPATPIDTPATRSSSMSSRADRRVPEIVSDAVLEILKRDPAEFTGEAVYDEEILRDAGVEDFTRYNLTPGDPAPLSARTFDPEYSRN